MLLSWCGSAYATSYEVRRAASSSGPFVGIGIGSASEPRTFVDAPDEGAWYSASRATDTSGESAPSNVVHVVAPSELRMQMQDGTAAGPAHLQRALSATQIGDLAR